MVKEVRQLSPEQFVQCDLEAWHGYSEILEGMRFFYESHFLGFQLRVFSKLLNFLVWKMDAMRHLFSPNDGACIAIEQQNDIGMLLLWVTCLVGFDQWMFAVFITLH